jgi:hypothetical protein
MTLLRRTCISVEEKEHKRGRQWQGSQSIYSLVGLWKIMHLAG